MTKVASLIIFLLLLIGLIVGVKLTLQKTNLLSHASPAVGPRDVRISNLSENSFTVSWITNDLSAGTLDYGDSPSLSKKAIDDRDSVSLQPRFEHYVTVKKLDPEKEYSFKINSDGKQFGLLEDNPYKIKTAPISDKTPPVSLTIYGKVANKAGQALEGIIYANTLDSDTVSAYSSAQGNWILPINNLRRADLKERLDLSDDLSLTITFNNRQVQVKKVASFKEAQEGINLVAEILPSTIPTPSTPNSRDLNRDGVVNIFDKLLELRKKF